MERQQASGRVRASARLHLENVRRCWRGLRVPLHRRSISRPLGILSRAAKRIASGERSAALPAFASGEIGDLAQSFKAMTEGPRPAAPS
jgi:methyl-accepting chemotaxis protein